VPLTIWLEQVVQEVRRRGCCTVRLEEERGAEGKPKAGGHQFFL
jgi:hypothetical protein